MTPRSSSFDWRRALALVPFVYLGMTRLTTARDITYFVATQIVPTMWIVYRLSDHSLLSSITLFAAGFVAFTAVYEIGYLVNDAWDAKRDPGGRRRTSFAINIPYFLAFSAVRVALWFSIGFATGWLFDPVWLTGFGCLVIVFGLHNVIRSAALRAATFLQLAVFRIALPALGAIGSSNLVLVIVIATFMYAYLRLLSYLDSKSLLNIAERRGGFYPLVQIAIFVPMAVLVSVATWNTLPLEVAVYFLGTYTVNALRALRA